MKKEVILIGSGGNTLDIFETLEKLNFKVKGYIDKVKDINLENLEYLGNDDVKLSENDLVIITFAGIGKGIALRRKFFNIYKKYCISLIFPNCSVSKFSKISNKGVLICGSSLIKSCVSIEENVFINSGTIIGHHTIVKSNSVISLGVLIGGNVCIEENVFIGMGARIFQGVTIGKDSIVGAGCIIRKDLEPNSRII